jgi:hypothetical protein
MSDWLSTTKIASWMQILKSLPLDDGPDTTRAVVLTVNVAGCLCFCALILTGCVLAMASLLCGVYGKDAGPVVVILGAVLTAGGSALGVMIGFATSMNKARDAKPSQTVLSQTSPDGTSSVAAKTEG